VIQRLGGGNSKTDGNQQQEYLDKNKALLYYGDRDETGNWKSNRNSTRATYKHTFPQEGRELSADITYNYGNAASNSSIINNYLYPDGAVYKPSATVNNNGGGNNDQVTIQTDYVHPLGENAKFEAG